MSSDAVLEGMILVSDFSKLKGIPEEKVINMIRDGFYVGKIVGDTWYINSDEDSSYSSNANNDVKKTHKFQSDVNRAISAINVGTTLSLINSILHVVAFIIMLLFSSQLNFYGVFLVIFATLGILLSWAITYSLLSIVVTNALTAKHTIILSSKA